MIDKVLWLLGLILIFIVVWIVQIVLHSDGYYYNPVCPFQTGLIPFSNPSGEGSPELVPAILSQSATQMCSNFQKIPRKIYQTNLHETMPIKMKETVQTILNLNPEYDYEYFSNKRCRKFLRKHFEPRVLRCYDQLIPGAYKADLFRYCLLYIRGGVYIDTGFIAINPLRDFIRSADEFISARDMLWNGIYNAFICSVPEHPILKETIDLVLDRIERRDLGLGILHPTGPKALEDGFRKALQKYYGYESVTIQEQDYGSGVRLFQHLAYYSCLSGKIQSQGEDLFYTKYFSYRHDMKGYHKIPGYPSLYKKKLIYSNYQPEIPSPYSFQEDCPMCISSSHSVTLEKSGSEICVKAPRERFSSRNRSQRIPAQIYQSHLRSTVPEEMREAMRTVLNCNPDYGYRYFDSEARRKFIRKHFDRTILSCYDSLKFDDQIDLFRLGLLYIQGGIYIHSGYLELESLDSILSSEDEILVAQNSLDLFGIIPRHSLLKEALQKISQNYRERKDYVQTLSILPSILGSGARVLSYQKNEACLSGVLLDQTRREIFYTKYPYFDLDKTWYH